MSPPLLPAGSQPVKLARDDAGTGSSGSKVGLAKADLERTLLDLLSDSNRWTAVPKPKSPFGYVCVFYSARPSPRCDEGDVRLVGRRSFQRAKGQRCSIDAAVYFAPMRAPNVPEADASGVRTLESDGELFLYGEADDYVIEVQACPAVRAQARHQVAQWLKRAAAFVTP